mmetsp:Transcript_30071/g.89362  ORF Transcript_30071/g.89362 Transcript_30071/m.89362 type:complete len:244 (+) Transcript_30071:1138-1869(+)
MGSHPKVSLVLSHHSFAQPEKGSTHNQPPARSASSHFSSSSSPPSHPGSTAHRPVRPTSCTFFSKHSRNLGSELHPLSVSPFPRRNHHTSLLSLVLPPLGRPLPPTQRLVHQVAQLSIPLSGEVDRIPKFVLGTGVCKVHNRPRSIASIPHSPVTQSVIEDDGYASGTGGGLYHGPVVPLVSQVMSAEAEFGRAIVPGQVDQGDEHVDGMAGQLALSRQVDPVLVVHLYIATRQAEEGALMHQ